MQSSVSQQSTFNNSRTAGHVTQDKSQSSASRTCGSKAEEDKHCYIVVREDVFEKFTNIMEEAELDCNALMEHLFNLYNSKVLGVLQESYSRRRSLRLKSDAHSKSNDQLHTEEERKIFASQEEEKVTDDLQVVSSGVIISQALEVESSQTTAQLAHTEDPAPASRRENEITHQGSTNATEQHDIHLATSVIRLDHDRDTKHLDDDDNEEEEGEGEKNLPLEGQTALVGTPGGDDNSGNVNVPLENSFQEGSHDADGSCSFGSDNLDTTDPVEDAQQHLKSKDGATNNTSSGKVSTEQPCVEMSDLAAKGKKLYKKGRGLECRLCGYKTMKRLNMECHIRTHTGERPFKCPLCDAAFKQKHHLSHHMLKHTDSRPFQCESCDKAFKCKEKLAKHQVVHISDRNGGNTLGEEARSSLEKIKRYKCEQCDFRSAYPSDLSKHLRVHTGEKCFKCDFCNFATAWKKNLVDHRLRHTGEQPHKCRQCDYKTHDRAALKRHMSTHKKDKDFVCEFCGASFALEQAYRSHVVVHSEERRYACDQCDARYKYRSALRVHKMTHTGVKPYVCEQCGQGHTQPSHLRRHQENMHSNPTKQYTCRYCTYTALSSQSLNSHMRKHKQKPLAKTTKWTRNIEPAPEQPEKEYEPLVPANLDVQQEDAANPTDDMLLLINRVDPMEESIANQQSLLSQEGISAVIGILDIPSSQLLL